MAPGEKRDAILQAALEVIAERGLHDSPMSLIVQRSGVSAGTIYHHFANKEDLIHALYRHVKTTFNRALSAGYSPTLSREVAFRRIWLNAYRFYRTHLHESRFLDQYENSPYYRPHLPEREIVEEENLPDLYRLLYDDSGQRVVKDLPIDALYELSIGVAARMAKHRNAGLPDLDDHTLEAVANTCYQAITL
jgi:AcrR family transcriptional regulator